MHKSVLQHWGSQIRKLPVMLRAVHNAPQVAASAQVLCTSVTPLKVRVSIDIHWSSDGGHVKLVSTLVHASALAPEQLAQTRLPVKKSELHISSFLEIEGN